MRSTTPSGRILKGRRLDLHQHQPVYRTGASLFGHVGFFQQEREDSNPVGWLWKRSALPRARSYIAPSLAARGHGRNNYSFSVTFQYASLMNFDQLSSRRLWSA